MWAPNPSPRNSSSSNGEEHRARNTTLRSPDRTCFSLSNNNRISRRRGETSNSRTFNQQLRKGLEGPDHMILWPPMVIVQNTRSRTDENGKWVGIGKTKLLKCFKDYNISEVKNSYGPMGHCGSSLLVFPRSASGYLEAACLHRNFHKEGRGKDEWENYRSSNKQSNGDRSLYCYMASEGDMKLFNKHSEGKKKQKFEMKSYKMMVLEPFKKMEDTEHKLIQLREKLCLYEHEIETMKQRTREEIEKYRNEVDYLNNYYADTINQMSNNKPENIEREGEEAQKSFHMLANHCNEPTSLA